MKLMIAACVIAVFWMSCVLEAAPVEWPVGDGGNGHYYEVVVVDPAITWGDAKTEAENTSYLGVAGHLATITSAEENDSVTELMAGVVVEAWVGGEQLPDSEEPDEGWTWITGELWDYDNWRSGEPNDNNDNESVLEVYSSDHPPYPSVWNDMSPEDLMNAYVVEYTPEPATMSLLALGSLVALRRRRR